MASKFLITRPEQQAQDFVSRIVAQNCAGMSKTDSIIAPMLEVYLLPFVWPDVRAYNGIIITSTNALYALKQHESSGDKMRKIELCALPLYAVGQHTARKARAYGFSNIVMVTDTAQALFEKLMARPAQGRLLYLRGQDIRRDFTALERVDECIVYDARNVDTLSAQAQQALERNDVQAVTFFSARTARNFVDLIEKNELTWALENIKALCISSAVLESVRASWPGRMEAAQTPDFEGMKTLILQEYDEHRDNS